MADLTSEPPLPDVRVRPDLAKSVFSVGDIDIVAFNEGVGGFPLLLVHGYTGARWDFAWHIPALVEAGFHVVAPDLRGHGDSSQPTDEGAYSLPILAADLAVLIESLGWMRPAVLGHSMGGMVVQELVLARPDLVGSLVLMDTSPGPPDGLSVNLAEAAAAVARERGMEALLVAQRALAESAPLTSPAFMRVYNQAPGYAEFSDGKFLSSSPAMYAALGPEIVRQPDRCAALDAVQVPTLVILGSQDEAFVEPSRAIVRSIPGARLAVIPDAGHSPQFENGPAWLAVLLEFLREATRGNSAATTTPSVGEAQ